MTEQSFTLTIPTGKSAETILEAVLDVRGWWSKTLVGASREVCDVFTYEVPGVHRSTIRVTEVVPGERVVWRVLDNRIEFVDDKTEWNDTEIRFEVVERDGGADLRFTHVGLVPSFECFEACHHGWTFYIGTSLRDLVLTGTGQPDEDPRAIAMVRANSA